MNQNKENILMKVYALFELPNCIRDFWRADVSSYGNLPEGTARLSLQEAFQIWKIIWWD